VARRDDGVRVYATELPALLAGGAEPKEARLDALIDLIARAYAPLPAASLGALVSRLRYGAPQWTADLKPALLRAKERLGHARVEGIDWYFPRDEHPGSSRYRVRDQARLLSPFDPVVWDRRRFGLLWGWAYRFEAYTPPARRKLGYYALPLLWGDRVIGWGNVSSKAGQLACDLGFASQQPKSARFKRAIEAELEHMREFLR
jgi:uncharacterized protein YcaQ